MDPEKIVAAASPAFQELHAAIGALMTKRFPGTRLEESFGMAAWVCDVDDPPQTGTMPPTFTVGPTEKKAGITVHVWHPHHPDALAKNKDWLAAAGFKPMVGCLQWNRKTPFPLDTFARLLDAVA